MGRPQSPKRKRGGGKVGEKSVKGQKNAGQEYIYTYNIYLKTLVYIFFKCFD